MIAAMSGAALWGVKFAGTSKMGIGYRHWIPAIFGVGIGISFGIGTESDPELSDAQL